MLHPGDPYGMEGRTLHPGDPPGRTGGGRILHAEGGHILRLGDTPSTGGLILHPGEPL